MPTAVPWDCSDFLARTWSCICFQPGFIQTSAEIEFPQGYVSTSFGVTWRQYLKPILGHEGVDEIWTGQVTEEYCTHRCSVTASSLLNLHPLLSRAQITHLHTISVYVPLVLSVLFSPRDPCLGIQARLLKEHRSARDKGTSHRFYAQCFISNLILPL